MKEFFEKFAQKLKANRSYFLVVLLAAFFFYNLAQILSSPGNMKVFSMVDFAVLAPFYMAISFLVIQLNWIMFTLLYAFSALFYLSALYTIIGWVEGVYRKIKARPKFELRQI